MLEKPFGMDLDGARRLNEVLSRRFEESQIYRIDHYLAKDTVQNLLVTRFSNSIFEPLWNRNYIDHVQITAAEPGGVEGRGGYYDGVGAVRDMLQNHVLQVLALTAMEPPLAGDVESVRDKKTEVFKGLAPIGRSDFALGQYRGYTDEQGVEPDSVTPTYAAARLELNSWRWRGVPFYLRTGKRLPRKLTEVIIQFKEVPLCALPDPDLCSVVGPNRLVVRIQPDEGIGLFFAAKSPGRQDQLQRAQMRFSYSDLGGEMPQPYERVILDGLRGEPGLFWRADGMEAAWRAVQPLLEAEHEPEIYEPGSWGPDAAREIVRRDGRTWLEPSTGGN
jgi:glucose-6-phosphate 1-dehydrogenase